MIDKEGIIRADVSANYTPVLSLPRLLGCCGRCVFPISAEPDDSASERRGIESDLEPKLRLQVSSLEADTHAARIWGAFLRVS